MKPNKLLFVAFAVVAMAQLIVPGWMISTMADIAKTGNEFVFKVRHNRAGASLNGNYVWLSFEANKFKVADKRSGTTTRAFLSSLTKTVGVLQGYKL